MASAATAVARPRRLMHMDIWSSVSRWSKRVILTSLHPVPQTLRRNRLANNERLSDVLTLPLKPSCVQCTLRTALHVKHQDSHCCFHGRLWRGPQLPPAEQYSRVLQPTKMHWFSAMFKLKNSESNNSDSHIGEPAGLSCLCTDLTPSPTPKKHGLASVCLLAGKLCPHNISSLSSLVP